MKRSADLTALKGSAPVSEPELGAEQMTPLQLERRLLELRMLFRTEDKVVRRWAWDEFRKLHAQRSPEVVKQMERAKGLV
jgi:hypothetical protein